jgi:uncharacterized repeat protein (TIGR01451 family)
MLNQISRKTKINSGIIASAVIVIVAIATIIATVFTSSVTTVSLVSAKEYFEGNSEQLTGKVIVKYVDRAGEEIDTTETVEGICGEEYNVEPKSIEGYLIQKYPVNKRGNFAETDETVYFIYEKDVSSIDERSDGKNVVVTVFKNKDKKPDEYKFVIKTIDEKGNPLPGTTYRIVDENSVVIRTGKDYTGEYTIGGLTNFEEGTNTYKISELESLDGYYPLDGTIDVNINKTKNDETDNIDMTATLTERENVTLEVDEETKEIVITYVKKAIPEEPKPEEPKPEEPDDPEPPTPPAPPITGEKIFDLTIDKKIKTIDVVNEKENKSLTKTSSTQLMKVDVPKSQINKTTLTVKYDITVTNVGEVAGYALSIKDNLPKNMKLAGDQVDWSDANNSATLTKLASTRLEPGESVTEEIVLTINLTENDVGMKINTAEITSYYNEEGLIDATPDNVGSDSFIVAIKTGHEEAIALLAVVALAATTMGVYLIKKKYERK